MLCLCKDINWESNTTDVRSLFVTSVIQKTTEGGHGGRKADLCEFGDSLVIKQVLGQPNSETLSLKTKQTQKTTTTKKNEGYQGKIRNNLQQEFNNATFTNNGITWDCTLHQKISKCLRDNLSQEGRAGSSSKESIWYLLEAMKNCQQKDPSEV